MFFVLSECIQRGRQCPEVLVGDDECDIVLQLTQIRKPQDPNAVCLHLLPGPLMGGPQCRLSILRNGNVPCQYVENVPVDFRMVQCRMSLIYLMSHVGIKKWPCRPVEFKGQERHYL